MFPTDPLEQGDGRSSPWSGRVVALLLVLSCVLIASGGLGGRALPSAVSPDGLGALMALADPAPLATLTATPSVARTLLPKRVNCKAVIADAMRAIA